MHRSAVASGAESARFFSQVPSDLTLKGGRIAFRPTGEVPCQLHGPTLNLAVVPFLLQPYPSLTLALAIAIAGAGTVHTPLERDQGHPLVLGAVHLARHAALVRRLDGCATRTARVRTAAHWGRTRWPMAAIPTETGAAGGQTKYGVAARLRLQTYEMKEAVWRVVVVLSTVRYPTGIERESVCKRVPCTLASLHSPRADVEL